MLARIWSAVLVHTAFFYAHPRDLDAGLALIVAVLIIIGLSTSGQPSCWRIQLPVSPSCCSSGNSLGDCGREGSKDHGADARSRFNLYRMMHRLVSTEGAKYEHRAGRLEHRTDVFTIAYP
jgi:hypothetical protein